MWNRDRKSITTRRIRKDDKMGEIIESCKGSNNSRKREGRLNKIEETRASTRPEVQSGPNLDELKPRLDWLTFDHVDNFHDTRKQYKEHRLANFKFHGSKNLCRSDRGSASRVVAGPGTPR